MQKLILVFIKINTFGNPVPIIHQDKKDIQITNTECKRSL